jgi:hypothetical protein
VVIRKPCHLDSRVVREHIHHIETDDPYTVRTYDGAGQNLNAHDGEASMGKPTTSDDGKKPWLKDPDDRWHTKIVHEEDWPGSPVTEREVACNCDLFDEGETHYDFDGM